LRFVNTESAAYDFFCPPYKKISALKNFQKRRLIRRSRRENPFFADGFQYGRRRYPTKGQA